MPRGKKSKVVNPNPPKRPGANRRKAQADPIAQMYAEQQEDFPQVRTKRPRKTSAAKRKRSGGVIKSRGKKKASRSARTRTATRRRKA